MIRAMQDLRSLLVVMLVVFAGCGADTTEASGGQDGSGRAKLVPGWSARLDDPAENIDLVEQVAVDGGYEVSVGPNVVLWHPDNTAQGSYRLSVEVTHLETLAHPHGAGLVFGGSNLNEPDQKYVYFLVRGDGNFLIKTRLGDETAEVAPWTVHPAITIEDAEGVAKNKLAIEVGDRETRFLVNDTEVFRAANDRVPADGVFGFRLVHNLRVRFTAVQLSE